MAADAPGTVRARKTSIPDEDEQMPRNVIFFVFTATRREIWVTMAPNEPVHCPTAAARLN